MHILVAGDPTLDHFTLFLPPRRDAASEDWRWYERYIHTSEEGGVHLTWRVLQSLFRRARATELIGPFAPHRAGGDGAGDESARALHSMVELRCLDPKKSPPRFVEDPDNAAQASARVTAFRGYALRPLVDSDRASTETTEPATADLIILNDAGGALGQDAAFFAALANSNVAATSLVLHKRHGTFQTESGATAHLNQVDAAGQRLWEREQLVLHLSADDLRRDGTPLRGRIGWRDCIEDLRAAAQPGRALARALEIYGAVVVQIGVEGAALLVRDAAGQVRCDLAYAPAEAEGFTDETLVGLSYGIMNAFLCALAARVAAQIKPGGTTPPRPRPPDVLAALATCRAYARMDFSVDLTSETGRITPPVLDKVLPKAGDIALARVAFPADLDRPAAFGLPRARADRMALAEKIVIEGMQTLSALPHIRINKLWAVESDEIVAYREIRRVILNYLSNPSRMTPLSIAVFGAPGSGKSFGIKQMTEDHAVTTKEFNLSESEANDLPGYFQELRDIRADGKTPLCFFDEFDRNSYELVARFLAPMQDGMFRHGGRTHPLGRTILVFAGGTAPRFADFQAGTALPGNDADRAPLIKSLKLPDFASRLDGVLDIKDLNPAEGAEDDEAVLRRAIILRSTLDRFAKRTVLDGAGRAMISPALLRALLCDASYRSGARSLEKIVTMSALRGNGHDFSASDLPSRAFLEPHLKGVSDFLKAAHGGLHGAA